MLNEDKLPGQYPDYLNKGDGESLREFYESSLILGKLYREVRIDRHHERILLDDFEVSILLKYELMPGIIKRGYEVSKEILYWLPIVYENVVKPMTTEVKEIMKDF